MQPSISLDSATLEAVSRWARGILGAPRRFAEHMVATKAEDEVILRLATEIERRSLVEQRAASGGRVGIEAQIDPAAIDPFAVDENEIRLKTEHIEICRACKGSRLLTCGKCSGEGRHKCDICGGSGKILKLYKKSSRMINCQACRSKGHVQCELCAGKKAICCQACEGSGTELVWLAMSRSKRTELSIVESAVLRGHRQLLELRFLEPKDLSAFADVKDLHSAGPLPVDVLHSTEAVFVKEKSPVCEPRVERIASQQLVRFSALRRDVTYEMALQRATLVLSGKHLQGSPTPESTKPIRTRLWIWSALSAVIGVLVFIACGGLLRKSPYYAAANNVTVFIGMLAVVFGVLMAGTALRVLRPGFRFWPLRRYEKGIALALLLDLAALPVPRYVGRPSIAEARAALVRGDLARSRELTAALLEAQPGDRDILELEDELVLAQARSKPSEAKLVLLDMVARRGGTYAETARAEAIRERLAQASMILDQGRWEPALAYLDAASAALAGVSAASELRARAFDRAQQECRTDACRYTRARQALAANSTPERGRAAAQSRDQLLAVLRSRTPEKQTLVARYEFSKKLGQVGLEVAVSKNADIDVIEAANRAIAWSNAEIAKTPAIGLPESSARELLYRIGGDSPYVIVSLAQSASGQCDGVYVATNRAGASARPAIPDELARRLLAQSVGKPLDTTVKIRQNRGNAANATWQEAGQQVNARWRDTQLTELRIGNAAP